MIPTLQKLKDHCQYKWNNYSIYNKHTTPDYEEDVRVLCDSYTVSGIHKKRKDHKLHSKDMFTNAYGKGEAMIIQEKVVMRWHK